MLLTAHLVNIFIKVMKYCKYTKWLKYKILKKKQASETLQFSVEGTHYNVTTLEDSIKASYKAKQCHVIILLVSEIN